MVKPKIDMTGWRMWEHGVPDSKLVVLKQVEDYISPTGLHKSRWLCECQCEEHNQVFVTGDGLTHKTRPIKSCGCLKKKHPYKPRKRNKNKFDLESYEYGVGWTSNTNQEFYFDLEDYEKIKDHYWHEAIDKNGYHYLAAQDYITSEQIRMQWVIIGKNYDHKDRNTFNNRKENLRPCTIFENNQNRTKGKNNTSGVIGVYLYKKTNKWIAYIMENKNRIYLGSFDNKDDAIKARLKAEIKYFGDFAPQKHLFEKYEIYT